MEKNQYKLCLEILKRLNQHNLLNEIVLIGSWCLPFYTKYFKGQNYLPNIRTRDIDLFIPRPMNIKTEVDLTELFLDLGFIVNFVGKDGYIKLEHPELIIEFLVAEKGKGIDKPVVIKKLGINAVALRFLNLLHQKTIQLQVEGFEVTLPHPANYAIHKLVISNRRKNADKAIKDSNAAIEILKALDEKKENQLVLDAFNSLSKKWKNKIIKKLENLKEFKIIDILKNE